MPLEAPCQDTPDFPITNEKVAHDDVIGVAPKFNEQIHYSLGDIYYI
jgi:hypothetical protein